MKCKNLTMNLDTSTNTNTNNTYTPPDSHQHQLKHLQTGHRSGWNKIANNKKENSQNNVTSCNIRFLLVDSCSLALCRLCIV